MPLHGKIVVIKRSGADGTEFPLTATCLFGRKPDCDIRIQLPQVSREHCRIDLNENKEVILTNLSSANPTRINGEAMQQSDRLKHGDVITIIDRSFRFEYPPEPTPKKRSSIGGKTPNLKVLKDQQVVDIVTSETGDNRISEVSTDPHLKDGTNNDNIQRSMEKTLEIESKEDSSLLQDKTNSPFNDLYQMIKKSLDVKTPRQSSASLLQTPTSRFCTPKPLSVRKNSVANEGISKMNEAQVSLAADATKDESENKSNATPKSAKKQRRSFQIPFTAAPEVEKTENSAKSEASTPQKRNCASPQRFTAGEVLRQVATQSPKSPLRRRSKEMTPVKPALTKEEEKANSSLRKASPRNSEKVLKVETSKKRKSGEVADLPTSQMKRKRVSFGGPLCPELFDKRLPPDSPLRKGADPRRSLVHSRPKQSLLRRTSVIGLLQEFDQDRPGSPAKMKTPSPKKSKSASPKTPTSAKKSPKSQASTPKAATPAKRSPKSKTPSPKAATPAKRSPKSKTPSPKAATPAKRSPKSKTPSPKAATPAKRSPKSKTPSPKAATPAKRSPKSKTPSPKAATPAKKSPKSQTPTVKGRFSVSLISTPSPMAEDTVTDQVAVTATPKIPLRRKSMKSSSRTPNVPKSAVKAVLRRSGISRASMKAANSWANIVKFGQPKTQVAAPAKKTVGKKTMKKAVPKPQTPARKLKDHVSTGHANSPLTIVVGRAHRQKVMHPTGAVPRLVTNTAILKKNMKMDEDLSGVSEMFKTPVNERTRKSVINESSAMKTPVGILGTSTVEASVLNTPEEPGEMMVSPLNVSSTVKDKRYNSEAVQRLLNGDEESSFVCDIPNMEPQSDQSSEQKGDGLKTTSATTPKQKPELPECLTGVKRIMKTPKQKAEPIEDLRGKILKTPKQKIEQPECLTGVKRIMRTPRQKAEPVEDLRGKILKTPKQKLQQPECLTGVKRIMKTPRQNAEPIEDIRGNIFKTPKQKLEQQECLSGVKRIMETPQQEAKPLEDFQEKTLDISRTPEAGDVSIENAQELADAPVQVQESEDLSEQTEMETSMQTPEEMIAPVEEEVSEKIQLVEEKSEPVEENFDELQKLVEEPLTDLAGQKEINVVDGQTPDGDVEVAKELDLTPEGPHDAVPSDVIDVDTGKDTEEPVVDDLAKEEQSGHDETESSVAMETFSEAAVEENLPEEQPTVDAVVENVKEQNVETATLAEIDTTPTDPEPEPVKKPVRGRRAKATKPEAAEEEPEAAEHSEDPVAPAPVRGRRGKKAEAAAPPAARQTTRRRNAKTADSPDAELTEEKSLSMSSKVAVKPKRGRNAKKVSDDQAEIVQEIAAETDMVPEPESEVSPPDSVNHDALDSAAPLEKAVSKPKRGRKVKQPEQVVPDLLKADLAEESDANEVCSHQLEAVSGESNENKSSDVMETVLQAPVAESLPEVEAGAIKVTETVAATQKSVRGRRAKVEETKATEEAVEVSEEPVTAPVRGRRGKKTEATAPPAARQTKRGRSAASQEKLKPEMGPDESVETNLVTETYTEAVTEQNTHQEDTVSVPPEEEAVVKPTRGRKTKLSPVEPPQPELEKMEVVSDKPQKTIPAPAKSRRGRKTKTDTVEENEVGEDTVAYMETKQQSKPVVRARRGRNAKQAEEKPEDEITSTEASKSQEPVKQQRRTRKADEEPKEVPTADVAVLEGDVAPVVVEQVEVNEPAPVAPKPRRGGRKAKQDTESETPVESTEVAAESFVEKPKRGRRGKQVTEDVVVPTVVPEENPDHEVEEKKEAEPEAPVIKQSRARGVKSSVKNEVAQAVPAKRARRGAVPTAEETTTEGPVEPPSVEPVKKGRRAAAKPTTGYAATIDEANSSAVEDAKNSKRSIKWKSELEIFEIPQATPVKAARGRKTKLADKAEPESKDANKTEEKDLSDQTVEAQPPKRARRGAKVAEVSAEEAETQPKTRRGRIAKK